VDIKHIFSIGSDADSIKDVSSIADCLKALQRQFSKFYERPLMKEDVYVQELNEYLQKAAKTRLEIVARWLEVNVARFPDQDVIVDLRRRHDDYAKALQQGIEICGSGCASCNLQCLEHKQHRGVHDCLTDHKCPRLCGFDGEHESEKIPSCGMPSVIISYIAMYTDYAAVLVIWGAMCTHKPPTLLKCNFNVFKYRCRGKVHLCGSKCELASKKGCYKSCVKVSTMWRSNENAEIILATRA
jgi:hypothetical protein